jgi:hypothetical protein
MILVMLTLLALSICNIHWKVRPKRNNVVLSVGHDDTFSNFQVSTLIPSHNIKDADGQTRLSPALRKGMIKVSEM